MAGQLVLASAKGSTSGAPAARTTRAAIVSVHPVSVRSSTSSTGPPAASISAGIGRQPRPVQRGDAIGGVRRGHGPTFGRVPQGAEVGQPAESGQLAGQRRDQQRMAVRVQRHHRRRPGRPVPRRQHLHRGLHHVVGHLAVGFVEQTPQPRAPAQIGQPADDAAGCGPVADLSAEVHAELAQPGRPLLARRESPPRAASAAAGCPPRRVASTSAS